MSNQAPVQFVNAEIRQSKETGSYYLWSKPIDLSKCVQELGSNMVNITITIPRNAKDEYQRLIIIKPAMIKSQASSSVQNNQERIPI